jgi:hypothetical protein
VIIVVAGMEGARPSVVAGMGSQSRPDIEPWPEISRDFRIEALRTRLYEYSSTFAAAVELAATSIEQRTTDPAIRRNAVLWRVRAVPEMRKACFRLEPMSGLVDAWVLARQMDQLFSEGAGASAFGPFQGEVVAVSHRLAEQMQAIGGSITVSAEARAEFERRIVQPWLTENPLRDLTFARESTIARFSEQSRDLGDLPQSVGTIEELAIMLSQQMRIYLADLPRQVQGEVDLLRNDLLTSENLVSLQGDLDATATSVESIAGDVGRIAEVADDLTPLVEKERKLILEEVNRQRSLVLQAVSSERERAMAAVASMVASERAQLLAGVEAQRLATLEWATRERRETIEEVRRELASAMKIARSERVTVVEDVRGIVDTVLLRVALFLLAGVVLAPLVAHVYARIWPKRTP